MFDKIVAAIDSEPARAEHVVTAAGDLAKLMGAQVVVVHVRELERSATLIGAARPGALPVTPHMESEEDARHLVDNAVARLEGTGIKAEGRVHPGSTDGSTARELVDIAESVNANLIVVGDRGSRVSDVLLGGVAHKIVQQATCSVLLVR